ncbi:MAG: hypothetical protein LBF91_08245 [Azoarcus sp.]|nr:hypothetical protein [Azoarcus sp.]
MARTAPDLPCTALLATEEWQALTCHARGVAQAAQAPPSLRQALLGIANMAGSLARKNDKHPGPQTLCLGFQHLSHITQMSLIMRQQATCG